MKARAKNPIQPGDGDERHGTAGGWRYHGCECDLCTACRRAYYTQWRRKNGISERTALKGPIAPGDGDPRHGTVNGYSNLACRCEPCTAAWRESHRRYMHADPARLQRHAERTRNRRAEAVQ